MPSDSRGGMEMGQQAHNKQLLDGQFHAFKIGNCSYDDTLLCCAVLTPFSPQQRHSVAAADNDSCVMHACMLPAASICKSAFGELFKLSILDIKFSIIRIFI